MRLQHLPVVLASLLLCSVARPQGFWLQPSSTWHETYAYFDGTYLHHAGFDIVLDGDTTIANQTYHQLRRYGTDTTWAIGGTVPVAIDPLDDYLGALREDTVSDRWWVVFEGFQNEELLFEFALASGQVISGTYGDCAEGYTVDAIDSVPIGSSWRHRYHAGPWSGYIIEGIGMHSGLFGRLCLGFEEFGCLRSYAVGGDTLAVDGCQELTLALPEPARSPVPSPFPNPATDRCQLGEAFTGERILILDATGRVVAHERLEAGGSVDLHALRPGLYVLRGPDWQVRVIRP